MKLQRASRFRGQAFDGAKHDDRRDRQDRKPNPVGDARDIRQTRFAQRPYAEDAQLYDGVQGGILRRNDL
jgi:hypothetical protein